MNLNILGVSEIIGGRAFYPDILGVSSKLDYFGPGLFLISSADTAVCSMMKFTPQLSLLYRRHLEGIY